MKDGQTEQEGYEMAEMEEEGEDIDLNGGGSTLIISESALSINGDDSRESFDQLSIDTGADTESEPTRPSIRVAKGLIKDNSESQQPRVPALPLPPLQPGQQVPGHALGRLPVAGPDTGERLVEHLGLHQGDQHVVALHHVVAVGEADLESCVVRLVP